MDPDKHISTQPAWITRLWLCKCRNTHSGIQSPRYQTAILFIFSQPWYSRKSTAMWFFFFPPQVRLAWWSQSTVGFSDTFTGFTVGFQYSIILQFTPSYLFYTQILDVCFQSHVLLLTTDFAQPWACSPGFRLLQSRFSLMSCTTVWTCHNRWCSFTFLLSVRDGAMSCSEHE